MQVIVNPYHRSVTIDGVEVVHKILEFPNELNHLATISCTYDNSTNRITDVHDLHRFTSNYIEREYFFTTLPVFVDWYYQEKQAQIDEAARQQKYKEDVENAVTQTVQAGIDAQANIKADKDAAITSITTAKNSATSDITSRRTEAVSAIQANKIEALNAITDTTNSSVSSVTGAMNTALNNIATDRASAVNAIATDKADALSSIATDRRTSLDEINSSINKATAQADRAKFYADNMAAVANVEPATKESRGLVQIGDNIDVDELGIISVDLSGVDTALTNAANAQEAAEAAQTTADNAITNAETAQTTADSAIVNAAVAQSTADSAVSNAATAQSTANTAISNAAAAQSTANTALANAASAQTTANVAQTSANAAQATANAAAVDTAVVHKNGTETINGFKIFPNGIDTGAVRSTFFAARQNATAVTFTSHNGVEGFAQISCFGPSDPNYPNQTRIGGDVRINNGIRPTFDSTNLYVTASADSAHDGTKAQLMLYNNLNINNLITTPFDLRTGTDANGNTAKSLAGWPSGALTWNGHSIDTPCPHNSAGSIGDWQSIMTTKLPEGGTWAYFGMAFNNEGNIIGPYCGVAAGGTTIVQAYRVLCALAWRIA